MEFEKLISERFSTRSFKPEHLTQEIIDKILKASHIAPTGCNWVRKYDGALSSPVDAAIVTTHMMLEAHNLGLGCCWVMHFDPAAMKREFNIPDGIEPIALLVMGHPAEDAKPLDMHFEYRPLDEVVFYDSF